MTDADIQSLFKKCYLKMLTENDTENDTFTLLEEYYSRKYKKSLWKSYAEYNTFLRDFTKNERKKIFDFLTKHSSYIFLKNYGYLSEEIQKDFNGFGLSNVVWVSGDSKLKNLDPDNTFILFKDGSLTYRSISSKNEIKPITTLDLFYIYYTPLGDSINKEEFIDYLKNKILNK